MATDSGGGGRLFLRSVRIDGYKCFSKFRLSFGDLTLLLGKNGCGKTTVFEVINMLARFACHGERIDELSPLSTLPRWYETAGLPQSFELRVTNEDGNEEFFYRLRLKHRLSGKNKVYVAKESLTLNKEPLFEFMLGGIKQYRNGKRHPEGVLLPFDEGLSWLAHAGERKVTPHLRRFRDWLSGITFLSLAPERMGSGSDGEAWRPNADGSNFASWYRWIEEQNDGGIPKADEALRRVLPGYRGMELILTNSRGHRELLVFFESENGRKQDYTFDELSAGQRVLIALYYFLHGGGCNRLLLLDEPDNFITLPEVQPLLLDIAEEAGDELPQVAMISHHPEAIDSIAPENAVWMDREAEQPARIVKFENDTPLHTSQLFSQGMAP